LRRLIRGGTVLTEDGPRRAQILISGDLIEAVLDPGLEAPADAEVFEAEGWWVMPGGIDAHVHSRDPGFPDKEDFDSLTAAAAAGGITTVVDMPNTVPAVASAHLLRDKAALVQARARVDFGLWGLVRSTSSPEALADLLAAGAVGLKAYLGYAFRSSDGSVRYSADSAAPDLEAPPDYGSLARLAPALVGMDALLAVHAEDAQMLREFARPIKDYEDILAGRPDLAEAMAISALGLISSRTALKVHIAHLSSASGLRAALLARSDGADLSLETCPQYLHLSAADYPRLGALMKMNPPIRTEADRAALLQGLLAGEISIVATDHAPHTDAEKLQASLADAHPGSPGVQTLYLSCLEIAQRQGDAWRAAAWASVEPARRLGLWPQKGRLGPGSDADLTLVEPGPETVASVEAMQSRQRHGALMDQRFGFAVRAVFSRGQLVAQDGRPCGPAGWGRMVRPHS